MVLRRKITRDGLQDGTIVECHNDTADKWYMKITDGKVCATDVNDPHLKLAQWFVSNSTSRIDASQQPGPCYIRTIIAIHSVPQGTARRSAAGGGGP
jgi:hypothetical protein